MTSLDEKVNAICENVSADFNALPYDERFRIARFNHKTQILTIWQMIQKDRDLTNERWRKKQMEWLRSCVESHQRTYGDF